ncbi:MAG: MarR family winged helix-turn-helix transcriptional regulator [Atopobiaceae bacterium]|jgi:DNA-binding MarR family transcriptional regulator
MHKGGGGKGSMSHILMVLRSHDGHMLLKDLQTSTKISSAALSEVVCKLEARELITKRISEDDARQRELALTDEGFKEAQQAFDRHRQFLNTRFECLDESERHQLVDMLDRLVASWSALDREEGCTHGSCVH